MAKDPAILFYFNDWQGGTMTLNRRQKGCYMDLLCAQFNTGHLSLDAIKTVLGNDFAEWGVLQKKFKLDDDGLFFNERLLFEKTKRKDFSEKEKLKSGKQSDRVKKRWDKYQTDTTVLPIIENRNEIEDVIENKIKEILNSTIWIEQTAMQFKCDLNLVFESLFGFLGELKLKDDLHKSISEIKKHFINWFKIQLEKKQSNAKPTAIEAYRKF